MKWLILIIVFFTGDPAGRLIISENSDYVEINHVYRYNKEDEVYTKRMTQVIWWEWRDAVLLPVLDPVTKEPTGDWKQGGAFVVRDYKVTWSESSSPQRTLYITPRRDKRNYICLFYDKDDKVIRKIISGWLTITHTTNDREMDNRQIVTLENRNELIKPQKN